MSVEERATAADRVLAARERYVARGVSTPTLVVARAEGARVWEDRKSTRLNSSHSQISYAAFCWKKKDGVLEQHHGLPRDPARQCALGRVVHHGDRDSCPLHVLGLFEHTEPEPDHEQSENCQPHV